MSSEITFIRNGNAPSSNNFNLKLSSNSIIKNLIIESQNNIFPEELNLEFKDFIGNNIKLRANKLREMGNIQEWEVDPVLTDVVKVKIGESEASIINVTPVLTDIKPYYAQSDVDTRIPKNEFEITSVNNGVEIELKNSKIIDRIKLNKNIANLEIFYSPGEGQSWISLTKIPISETLKIHPVMAKKFLLVGEGDTQLSKEEIEIFMFNYLSVEIENLFSNEEYTELKPEVTIERVIELQKKTSLTQEYIDKLSIAKNILIGGMMGEIIEYVSNEFKVVESFNFITEESIYRVRAMYLDKYGNEKSIETENISENKIVTFEKFYAKDITFTIFASVDITNAEIVEREINQDDYYAQRDIDTRIDKSRLLASSGCGVYGDLGADRAIDGDEATNFHSNEYSSIGYGDFYLKNSLPKVIDRINILTRPNSLGRIDNYKVLYKERSSEEWLEIGESINEGMAGNWRNIKFNPVFASEICIRVTRSNDNFVIIYEMDLFEYNKLSDILKDLFIDAECTQLKETVTLEILDEIESRLGTTEEYLNLFKNAKLLYINRLEPYKFEVQTENKSVISTLRLSNIGRVLKGQIKYIDEHGYEKFSNSLKIEENSSETTIEFEKFYGNSFELSLYGPIEQNGSIEVIEIPQDEFYANEDIDVRIDKSIITAKSLCGQYSNNSPIYAIDNNSETTFHSADYRNYGTGEYGDFTLELDNVKLINRVKFQTRSSYNGRIKAYEILYKTSSTEEWKKVYEQLAEESGDFREAAFKPVLASEICIRVTDGHNYFVVFHEIDLFKYNTLEEKISNLFTDETQTVIKDSVTLEDIENLEIGLITESYINTLKKAKELYIDSLIPEEFEVPLSENTVLDEIVFVCEQRILRVCLSYENSLGKNVVIRCNPVIDEENITLNFRKILTKKAKILMYGADRIHKVKNNSYLLSEFCINEDIDTRVSVENLQVSSNNEDSSYPLTNMFDKDIDTRFHSRNYNDYVQVNLKLDKEYLIDRLRLISFRSNTSGLINKFNVLVKDLNQENWIEFGSYDVESYKNEWLMVENIPYLTDEICVRVEDSVNKWVIINELELFIHNLLEDSINNLFEDSNFVSLKPEIKYEEILELEKKCLVTKEYKEKIKKAKNIYLKRIQPISFKIKNNSCEILNSIDVLLREEADFIYDIKLFFKNHFSELEEIEEKIISLNENGKIKVQFSEIFTDELKVEVYINEYEKWKINCIHLGEVEQSLYYNLTDTSNNYPIEKIELNTTCGYPGAIGSMIDGNLDTYYHSSGLGEIFFTFEDRKVIENFTFVSRHANGSNGVVYKATLYFKSEEKNDWKLLQVYETESPIRGENIIIFPPVLVKEICIKFERTQANVVVLNDIKFDIYNKLNENIENLFEDKILYKTLNRGVKLSTIEKFRTKISTNKILLAKLYIAESILKNKNELPFETYKIKSIPQDTNYYFNPLRTNGTGDISLTPYYIEPNKDYVIVCSKDLNAHIVLRENKPQAEHSFTLKRGINIINLGEITGQLVLTGTRKDLIEIYSLNEKNAIVYRYGITKEEEFYKIPNNTTLIEDRDGVKLNSNLAYIEGKNFIGAVKFDWLKNNISEGTLAQRIEITDEFLDFLYYIDNMNSHFNNAIPYKRVMWIGSGNDNPHAGGSFVGGYTAYSGGSHDILKSKLRDFAAAWVVGHEVGHEMDVNNYHMGLFGEVTNNWYANEARIEYTNSVRENVYDQLKILETSTESIFNLNVFAVLAFWYKFRLYYGQGDFFVKMHQYMQAIETSSTEDISGKLATYVTRIIKRDASDYFIKHGFTLTQEAIDYCNTYPKFTKDIALINWDNQNEFREEEKRTFNLNYKNNI
ncbi:discoidin domain-containing protein [Cetobacterium sp.]|uniref:discoidin domain-containing protein n=2 Tax=Cetobacterium sp. TaxID=2071632 RepID=UPI003EE775AF